MADQDRTGNTPQQPIGDPPTRKQAVRADLQSRNKKPDRSMMDPFTEQATRPAGDGQGASSAGKSATDSRQSKEDAGDEETMPVEEGFSAIP
jgi:hypothetical protein